MKATGIVRKVDNLGRVVFPIELRRTLNINVKDSLELFVDGDMLVFRKYSPACTFCSSADNVIFFQGKNVCGECVTAIHENVKE